GERAVRVAIRGGGDAREASRGARGGVDRCSRRGWAHALEGVRRAEGRAGAVGRARGGAEGLREGRARAPQVSPHAGIHRGASEDRDGQDPALQAARARGRQAVTEPRFAEIAWDARPVRVEYTWVGEGPRTMVFLHEGLGSRAMWRDFPAKLCAALGMRGLVYSRPGYGKSTPRLADERWQPDFMHRQAHDVLRAFLDAVGVKDPVWLYGHSDGGSIALLFAARFPTRTAGVIVAAPHVFVEDLS